MHLFYVFDQLKALFRLQIITIGLVSQLVVIYNTPASSYLGQVFLALHH